MAGDVIPRQFLPEGGLPTLMRVVADLLSFIPGEDHVRPENQILIE